MKTLKIYWRTCFFILFIGCGGLTTFSFANPEKGSRYPSEHWAQYQTAEDAGFISGRLAKVEKYYKKRSFAALLIIKDGAIAVDWGENNRRFPVHSIRKSMLSALYGVHSSNINFQASLADLEINDNGALTAQEQSATLLDVLSSRSGVYLPAAAEGGQMTSNRPERGSHAPGNYWWYNNWDFNVAGTIYTKLTGEDITQAFERHIAGSLQMQDFRNFDGYYVKAESEHPAVQFRMSSRDLARMGLLYARNGNWRGKQIIPKKWVKTSTQAASQTNMGNKYPPNYGYMWWVENDGSYSARGVGGHVLAVFPDRDMVVVLRTNSYLEHSVSARAIKKILEGIVSASEGQPVLSPKLTLIAEEQDARQALPSRLKNIASTITLGNGQVVTLNSNDKDMFVNFGTGELELRYLRDNQFIIKDRQEPLDISLNADGKITGFRTPRLFYLRAAHVAQQGDLDKASYWVKEVISMLPESAMAYTNMAKIYIAQGDIINAKKMLNEALKYDPKHKQATALKQTLAVKKWPLPAIVALGVGLMLFAFVILRKRRK